MRRIRHSISVLCVFSSSAVSAEEPVAWADLFSWLDLGRPGLESTRDAVGRKDWPAAAEAFAAYLQARRVPVYPPFAAGAARPAPGPGDRAAWERILRHETTIGGVTANPGFPVIDWDFQPGTDREWKWGLNRHYDWARRWGGRWDADTLAAAWLETKDDRYAAEFARQLASWLDTSVVPLETKDHDGRFRTIECGIRLSAIWPPAWYAFRDSPSFPPVLQCRMVRAIAQQARYLARHPKARGNWADMEANGLVHAGVLFPEFREAAEWRRLAVERLGRSLEECVYPDGPQAELTTSYHNVTLVNQAQAAELLLANGYEAPMRAALVRMYEADLWNLRPDGTLPMWNDSDVKDVRDILLAGADLFGREDFRYAATGGREGKAPGKDSRFFPHAGWAVFRSGWEPDARYFAADVGPFGIGHQHEDKLSIDTMAYGQAMVVDPGRYTYDAGPWRNHFLSSAAHNVVLVDGRGQNRRARPGAWQTAKPLADAVFVSTDAYDYARGTYRDGYGPENDASVTHVRHAVYLKGDADYWVIHDRLSGTGEHRFDQLWHLTPCEVDAAGASRGLVRAVWPGAQLQMRFVESGNEIRVLRGQETPEIQGWYSPAYGVKHPAPCVIVTRRTACPATFTTVLFPSPGEEQTVAVEPVAAGDVTGVRVLAERRKDAILFAPGEGKHKVGEWEFEGEIGVFRR